MNLTRYITIAFALLIPFQILAQKLTVTDKVSYVNDSSAIMEVISDDRGVLIPKMDYNMRPANPANGLLIYITSNGPYGDNAFYYFDGQVWNIINKQTINHSSTLFSHLPDPMYKVEPLVINIVAPGYVVPNGKNLYIRNFYPAIEFQNFTTTLAPSYHYIFTEGDIVTCAGNSPCHAQGFLVDKFVEPIFLDINSNPTYQVPIGKIFVIYNSNGSFQNPILIDGIPIHYNWSDMMYNENQLIDWAGTTNAFVFGYLMDKN